MVTVSNNKVQLIEIIYRQLTERALQINVNNIQYGHRLIVTGQDPVRKEIHRGILVEWRDLTTTHEEADVIIPHQTVTLARQGIRHITVICDDTNVFILLVHEYLRNSLQCTLFMVGTSPSRTVIDIAATAKKHAQIAPSLLSAHALSGCDTTAYYWGVGKVSVVKVLQKGHKLLTLGNLEARLEDVVQEATLFVATCYCLSRVCTMSDAR